MGWISHKYKGGREIKIKITVNGNEIKTKVKYT